MTIFQENLENLLMEKEQDPNLSLLGNRLSSALKFRKKTQTELATHLGIKPQAIQAICANKVKKSRYLYEIADYLDISADWLRLGTGRFTSPHNVFDNGAGMAVPIVSWAQAANKDYSGPLQYIASNAPSKHLYALIVEDESMSPKFDEGYVLVVNPKKKPSNKDFVIILLENGSIFVRQYIKTQTSEYFRAFSEGYNIIYLNDIKEIIGVVVETIISFYDN